MKDTIHFTLGHEQYTKEVDDCLVFGVIETSEDGQFLVLSNDGGVGYLIHNDRGPAIIQEKLKRVRYMRFGQPHRVDGPADIQQETDETYAFEEYAVFGLPLEKETFEKYSDFIRRAATYIDENNLAMLECDMCDTSASVVKSFDSIGDFIKAAESNTLEIQSGPRDAVEKKTITLPTGSGIGGGLAFAAFGLLAGGLLVASSSKKKQAVVPSAHEATCG